MEIRLRRFSFFRKSSHKLQGRISHISYLDVSRYSGPIHEMRAIAVARRGGGELDESGKMVR